MMLMLKANNGEIRGMRIVGRPFQSVLLLQGMKKSKKIKKGEKKKSQKMIID